MQCNVMQHNVMYVWYGMIWSGLVCIYTYMHKSPRIVYIHTEGQ